MTEIGTPGLLLMPAIWKKMAEVQKQATEYADVLAQATGQKPYIAPVYDFIPGKIGYGGIWWEHTDGSISIPAGFAIHAKDVTDAAWLCSSVPTVLFTIPGRNTMVAIPSGGSKVATLRFENNLYPEKIRWGRIPADMWNELSEIATNHGGIAWIGIGYKHAQPVPEPDPITYGATTFAQLVQPALEGLRRYVEARWGVIGRVGISEDRRQGKLLLLEAEKATAGIPMELITPQGG